MLRTCFLNIIMRQSNCSGKWYYCFVSMEKGLVWCMMMEKRRTFHSSNTLKIFSYSLFRLCSWLLMYVMCHQININNIPAKEICNALNQVALFNIPPVVHFGRGGRYYKYIILSESETDPHLARRKIGWHWRNEEMLSERKVPIAPKLLHLKSSTLPAQIFAKDFCQ